MSILESGRGAVPRKDDKPMLVGVPSSLGGEETEEIDVIVATRVLARGFHA
jgi:hypothetical protein